jgi:hypothetical protein
MAAIKIVNYEGDLWRADREKSSNYSTADIKYFALTQPEIQTYVEKAKFLYKKHWRTKPGSTLNLINILDLATRKELEKIINKNALNTAFPIIKNKVSRVSEEETKHKDYEVLNAICAMGYDGYFMPSLTNNNGRYVFHSEIGLCRIAFHKIELVKVQKDNTVAPDVPGKKRRSLNHPPNNNARNTKKNNKLSRSRLAFNNNKNKV